MKVTRNIAIVLLALTATTNLAFSQMAPLKGSSTLELNLGLWNEIQAGQQISLAGIKQSAKASGFVGGLTYGYWMRENLEITIAASLLSSEASSTITFPLSVQQRSNSVVSFLVGMRYFVPQPEPEDRIRPYIAFGVGSYVGAEAENSVLAQSAHSESVVGGRLGVGLDALLGSWFKLGVNIGYNIMADFKTPVGARNNFNGYDMSVGFGFVF